MKKAIAIIGIGLLLSSWGTRTTPVAVQIEPTASVVRPTKTEVSPTSASTPVQEVAGVPIFVEEQVDINPMYEYVRAVVLDVDHDDDDDLVIMSQEVIEEELRNEGTTQVWVNDGNGQFSEATSEVLGGAEIVPDTPRDLELLDANGDGLTDIFVAQHGFDVGCETNPCPGAPNLLILSQPNGQLTEVASNRLVPHDENGFTHATAAADVDGDGDVDIYEGNWPNPDATALTHLQINSGEGYFAAEDDRLPPEVASTEFVSPGAEFCDLDRDGDPDLILGGCQERTRVLENDGYGRFSFMPEEVLPESYFGDDFSETDEVKCADFDLDGWPDLVLGVTERTTDTYATIPHLTLLRNNGVMTFTDITETHLPQSWTAGGCPGFSIADFNNDGWPDIVGSPGTTDYPRLFVNQGEGKFSENVFPAGTAIDLRGCELIPIDADGDGKLDIYAPRGTFEHFILWNRGWWAVFLPIVLKNH